MTRDPGLYPSLDIFDPERFLDVEGNLENYGADSSLEEGLHTFHVSDNKPVHSLAHPYQTFLAPIVCRVCPGLYFTIWIVITMILYCLLSAKINKGQRQG